MWDLTRPGFWVIVMQHPVHRSSSLLQAEESGDLWVLAFTSRSKAASAIDELGVAKQAHTVEVRSGGTLDLVSAVCRTGASGILVDFEPSQKSWSCRKRLVAHA